MVPVIGLCGYTNSGKSTLLNRMTDSEAVWAEDTLFATLDPTTRRIQLSSGKQALLTDTVRHFHYYYPSTHNFQSDLDAWKHDE